MRKNIAVIMTLLLLFFTSCAPDKTDTVEEPYSIAYTDVRKLYQEIPLSANNINDYYEFVTDCRYNENTGCVEYMGQLKPKADVYTCIDSEDIQISYTYQQNTYDCIYDVVTGEIIEKGKPVNTQEITVTEYINPYFSMYSGIISADYVISLDNDKSADEDSRYQQVRLTLNENITISDSKGTLYCFTVNDKLPWLYTHKAHDAFYGQGNYQFLQIEAEGGYCTLLFNNDNRHNVSARYFFDDGSSSGSMSMTEIFNDRLYGSLVTERGWKYILK